MKEQNKIGLRSLAWVCFGVIGVFGTIDLNGFIGEVVFPTISYFGFFIGGFTLAGLKKFKK